MQYGKYINLKTPLHNTYLLPLSHGGFALLDTGSPKGFDRFLKKLTERTIALSDIKLVVLTHAHHDHAGFLKEILDKTGAKVLLHPLAKEHLSKGFHSGKGLSYSKTAWLIFKSISPFQKKQAYFPAIELKEEQTLVFSDGADLNAVGLNCKLLYLAGHTADSVGLLFYDGDLFCGDACMNNVLSAAKHSFWIENKEDYQESWNKMIETNAKVVYPSHGSHFPAEELKKHKDFLNGKELFSL